ncbi:glycoside hydrolase family 31 protein [Schleiferilactobacillus harbinensis]|uniref:glycoside hydrolase family 31 protein n=1 Tax=Schleiferilactobacillus harbinensis TaxID=304207 RepID=UPI001238BB2B|nr:glycoside hydrolase family 31 protein [Schleiferilactobacillus harbinensis]
MTIFTKGPNYLECQNSNERLRIIAWGQNSFRVVATPTGPLDLACSALLPTASTAAVTVTDTQATITNGQISCVINNGDWWDRTGRLRFYNAAGDLLLEELNPGGALQRQARRFEPLSGGGQYALTASFAGQPAAHFAGMGQYQQTIADLNGTTLELAQRNSQASVPFYLSSTGYGFLWHNPAIGSVTFGKNVIEWHAQATAQLDYWITAGDTPAQIEAQYSAVVGQAPMMPDYGLGFWQSKLRYATQADVLAVARKYHELKIPVSVLVIDYYHWPRCGDYRFDPHFFPDPAAMAEECARYGIKLMVSVWPQIDERSENYADMRERGLLVHTNHGLPVQMKFHGNNEFYDATNPAARHYVWDKVQKNYGAHGIHLFWLDEAEPEFSTYDFANYTYYAGSVLSTGNLYPREYVRGFYEGEIAANGHPEVNLVRCAWVGSQRYGALVWSGDIHSTFQDLRNQISAGLHMGIAGIPWWTTDIGGFHGGRPDDPAFRELLVRWFQFGAFSPVMRIHGARQPMTKVYKADGEETEAAGAPNEVWSFGPEVEKILTKFIRIRALLKPYLEKVMTAAHETGAPVMRPLFYEFPNDQAAWPVNDQFLLGADILVAPIVHAGDRQREVYLPAGAEWTDARTGQHYAGGQRVAAAAPLDSLPVFLRDGRQTELQGRL